MSKDSSITSSKNKAEQENFEDFWTFLKFQVLQKAGGRILRIGEILPLLDVRRHNLLHV